LKASIGNWQSEISFLLSSLHGSGIEYLRRDSGGG
jgi:hypothetical protein